MRRLKNYKNRWQQNLPNYNITKTTLFIYMEFKAQQIAELIQGRVEGDPNTTINTFAKIEEGKPGAISFL